MNQKDLALAAFSKMYDGEPLSISDAQRVFDVFINKPPQIDSADQGRVQQFMAQVKEGIQKTFLGQ